MSHEKPPTDEELKTAREYGEKMSRMAKAVFERLKEKENTMTTKDE